MSLAVVAVAVLLFLLIIIDPKYGPFALLRNYRNAKFTKNYSLLLVKFKRLYDEYTVLLEKYEKRCNQSDHDNEQENFLRSINKVLAACSDSLTVAYDYYPWSFPFFQKWRAIRGLLNKADLVLGMCDEIQEIYVEKYGLVE